MLTFIDTGRKQRKILITLLVIFMGCNLMYFLFPFPPVYWRFLILLIYGIVILQGFRLGFSRMEKSLMLLVTYMSLWFIFTGTESGLSLYVNMLVALLSFPVFGVLGRSGSLSTKFVTYSAIALFICAVPYYYYSESLIRTTHNLATDRAVTVSASNIFLMLLPATFIVRNKKIGFAMICCAVTFLLLSAKRGNIIEGIIPVVLFVIYLMKSNNALWSRIIIIAALLIAFIYFSYEIQNNDYLLSRYESTLEGNSSERDYIYTTLWSRWINSPLVQILFGHGFLATMRLNSVGYMAHNDWLEILIDFGLTGALLYLLSFVFLTKNIVLTKDYRVRAILISILSIWFIKTMVSMGFFSEQLSFIAISYGWCCGKIREQYRFAKLQSRKINSAMYIKY